VLVLDDPVALHPASANASYRNKEREQNEGSLTLCTCVLIARNRSARASLNQSEHCISDSQLQKSLIVRIDHNPYLIYASGRYGERRMILSCVRKQIVVTGLITKYVRRCVT
jgi:hypothetical protein